LVVIQFLTPGPLSIAKQTLTYRNQSAMERGS
jgi:hypothetical protein